MSIFDKELKFKDQQPFFKEAAEEKVPVAAPPAPAAEAPVAEAAPAAEPAMGSTSVLCRSDCRWVESTDGTCTLNGIDFQQSSGGLLSCAQYQPAGSQAGVAPPAQTSAMPVPAPGTAPVGAAPPAEPAPMPPMAAGPAIPPGA